MEILVPGHRNDSAAQRLALTRQHLDHLPAWRCQPLAGASAPFFLCGKCFGKRGAGPYTNDAEVWMPGTDRQGTFHYEVVPLNARCIDCGGHAWPAD